MTYNVLMGTLNPTHSLTHSPAYLAVFVLCRQGNSALHYAMSNGQFEVVKLLLDTGMCDITRQNRTGCTAVMLASLVQINSESDRQVIRRLFQLGDINQQASLVRIRVLLSKLYCVCYVSRGAGIKGYWHQRADERHGNHPQGYQELLVVRNKVGRPQVSLR